MKWRHVHCRCHDFSSAELLTQLAPAAYRRGNLPRPLRGLNALGVLILGGLMNLLSGAYLRMLYLGFKTDRFKLALISVRLHSKDFLSFTEHLAVPVPSILAL
jgi:hypothetical protein